MKRWLAILLLPLLAGASGIMTTPGNPKIFSPLTVTCTTTAALSGTYQIDASFKEYIDTMLLIMTSHGGTFQPAMAQMSFLDTSNNLHFITNAASLNTFYGLTGIYYIQMIDYQNRSLAGQSPPALTTTVSGAC